MVLRGKSNHTSTCKIYVPTALLILILFDCSKIYQGKAILAHEAFDPVETEEATPKAKRSRWSFVKMNLHNIRTEDEIDHEEDNPLQNDQELELDQ